MIFVVVVVFNRNHNKHYKNKVSLEFRQKLVFFIILINFAFFSMLSAYMLAQQWPKHFCIAVKLIEFSSFVWCMNHPYFFHVVTKTIIFHAYANWNHIILSTDTYTPTYRTDIGKNVKTINVRSIEIVFV